jgi:hypothetical protein
MSNNIIKNSIIILILHLVINIYNGSKLLNKDNIYAVLSFIFCIMFYYIVFIHII